MEASTKVAICFQAMKLQTDHDDERAENLAVRAYALSNVSELSNFCTDSDDLAFRAVGLTSTVDLIHFYILSSQWFISFAALEPVFGERGRYITLSRFSVGQFHYMGNGFIFFRYKYTRQLVDAYWWHRSNSIS